jgi:integrase
MLKARPKPKNANDILNSCKVAFENECALKGLLTTANRVARWERFANWLRSTGKYDITTISAPLLLTWLESIGITQNTKRCYVLDIRRVLKVAWEEGVLDRKPALMRCPVPREIPKTRVIYTDEDLRKIEKYLYDESLTKWRKWSHTRWPSNKIKRFRVLFQLSMLGLRLGEMSGLKWSDVAEGYFKCRVKGGMFRNFPIDEDLKEALSEWLKVSGTSERVFDVTNSAVGSAYSSMLKAAGVEHRGRGNATHLMRHSVATRLYVQTKSIVKVQRYLGHKSAATTLRYIHVPMEEEVESLESVKNFMKKEGDKE